MLWLIDSLVHTDVVNFQKGWVVIAVPGREGTGTIWIATFEALAFATLGAWGGEAPCFRHGSIHEQIHWLTWDLRTGNRKTFTKDSINEFVINEPLDVSAGAVLFWRVPFHTVLVLSGVVRRRQFDVGREGIRLVCERFRFMDKRDSIEKRIQFAACIVSVFQIIVPLALLRELAKLWSIFLDSR